MTRPPDRTGQIWTTPRGTSVFVVIGPSVLRPSGNAWDHPVFCIDGGVVSCEWEYMMTSWEQELHTFARIA